MSGKITIWILAILLIFSVLINGFFASKISTAMRDSKIIIDQADGIKEKAKSEAKDIILDAQKEKTDVIEKAKQDQKTILAKAEQEKKEIIKKAENERKQILAEFDKIPPARPTISLCEAASRGDLKQLHAHFYWGCDVNRGDGPVGMGPTPLYLACENGQLEAVKLLVDSGADVNRGDNEKTPLVISEEKHFKTISEYLKNKGAK